MPAEESEVLIGEELEERAQRSQWLDSAYIIKGKELERRTPKKERK
jgi:hypothetical protein